MSTDQFSEASSMRNVAAHLIKEPRAHSAKKHTQICRNENIVTEDRFDAKQIKIQSYQNFQNKINALNHDKTLE